MSSNDDDLPVWQSNDWPERDLWDRMAAAPERVLAFGTEIILRLVSFDDNRLKFDFNGTSAYAEFDSISEDWLCWPEFEFIRFEPEDRPQYVMVLLFESIADATLASLLFK